MRTYAQDTALPGGKYEEGDNDSEGTAVCRHPQSGADQQRREAYEEVLLTTRIATDERLAYLSILKKSGDYVI